MGKKLRIFMILLNVIVFLIIDQSSVDYNAVNFFILNIFVLSVLLYLDNKKQSSVQNDFISFQEIIQGLKKLFMKPLNWLLLISPTVFYLENSLYKKYFQNLKMLTRGSGDQLYLFSEIKYMNSINDLPYFHLLIA